MKTSVQEYLSKTYSGKKSKLQELFMQMKDIVDLPSPEKEHQMIRLAIIAEMDAINLYQKMAENTDNQNLKELFSDIAREEEVHFGEFEEALEILKPDFEKAEAEGEEEAQEIMDEE